MIEGVIFDLDGTLVKTEELKARSYAEAAVELRPDLEAAEVLQAFSEVVGRSRREVATTLLEAFDLSGPSRERMEEFGVDTPWQVYVQVRLRRYEEMLSDPDLLRSMEWEHTRALLERVRSAGCRVALATMSRCEQARIVLEALGLEDAFDFVATRDDVEHPKPDPEILLLAAVHLDTEPSDTLVVEDSPSGVQAVLSAGMEVVAVATPFTLDGLQALDGLPPERLVRDPASLAAVVERIMKEAG